MKTRRFYSTQVSSRNSRNARRVNYIQISTRHKNTFFHFHSSTENHTRDREGGFGLSSKEPRRAMRGRRRDMSLTTFAIQAISDFRNVGAIAPSSRYLAHAMLGPLPLRTARIVVEVGPGTGAMTQALLELIPRDATLLALEINPRFSKYLKARIPDRRLVVINGSAEMLEKEVHRRGYERVDAVVSSLALGLMSDAKRRAFLGGLGS